MGCLYVRNVASISSQLGGYSLELLQAVVVYIIDLRKQYSHVYASIIDTRETRVVWFMQKLNE